MARSLALACFMCASLGPCVAAASAPPDAITLLDRESRILAAVNAHDQHALRTMLDENFTHITARGTLSYRYELAAVVHGNAPVRASEQTVDFFGDVAIVQGVLTAARRFGLPLRFRYTDVYRMLGGVWLLKSAQETTIAPS